MSGVLAVGRLARLRPALALMSILLPCTGAAADREPLDEVLQLLAARRHGTAHFEERHYLSLLKQPLESSGTLIYDAPDHLEKRTSTPRAESLVLNGRELTVERGHSSHALNLQSYPQALPFVESIRATLAGDRASLDKVFRVEFSGKAAGWTMVLTPHDPAVAKTVAEVRISGANDELSQVEIRQPDGDRSLMTLSPATP
jgi:hypothetical protein